MTPRIKWTEAELLIALNLYHKITFGQISSRQPLIVEVAKKMGRTPSSLSMKLGNLASFDPALQMRGIKGLSGASALDGEMWQRFHTQINEMAPASEKAFWQLFEIADDCDVDVIPTQGLIIRKRTAPLVTEGTATINVRLGQEFFREAVLNNFDGRCGVSQLAVRELLVASHIIPWANHPSERMNVRNGLCLSKIHEAAFDQGLITFDDSCNSSFRNDYAVSFRTLRLITFLPSMKAEHFFCQMTRLFQTLHFWPCIGRRSSRMPHDSYAESDCTLPTVQMNRIGEAR